MDDNEESPDKARMKPESVPGLVEFTSSELLSELMSRFDSSVFVGTSMRTETQSLYHRRYWGNHMECAGLCTYMQDTVLTEFKGECEDAQE
jgi:hypothetical protein